MNIHNTIQEEDDELEVISISLNAAGVNQHDPQYGWDALEREVKRRFSAVRATSLSHNTGMLKVTADFGSLSGRPRVHAVGVLAVKIKQVASAYASNYGRIAARQLAST